MKFFHHMHLHLKEIKMEKKTIFKVMTGILLGKPSIHTLSCSWVVVEFVTFLFDKFPSIIKSFFLGDDEIPFILHNIYKLWIFSFMCMD